MKPKLTVMKKLIFLAVLAILINSCATTSKTANKEINNAIIGQNEIFILKNLGMPTRVEHTPDGRKVMIYEFLSKGMYLTPNKSAITYNSKKDITGNRQGWTYKSNANTVTNDPKYTIYPSNASYFRITIDKQGNAVRIEHNLPQEQLEVYHERFKHFSNLQ